jgi:predicted metal-binding protein
MRLSAGKKEELDTIFEKFGYSDYKWIDPQKIVVAQWVRMKCMFGCGEYGRGGACPPNTPSVAECERFFNEYTNSVILRFEGRMEKPEDRHAWSRKINAKLVKLEREVFLAGYERAFLLFMDSCCICKECAGDRQTCKEPRMSRPAPEAMAVDVYSTVRQFGFPINVRTDYDQKMDRYAFLMIQ